MKLLFDNNLSPKIANAVKALCCGEKCEVVHLKEKFKADIKDEEWLSTLIEEGGWSILSIDRFKKNPVEKEDDLVQIREELADVVNYCVLMADACGLDLDEIVREKIKVNAKKYPVEKAKGKSAKYDKL